LRGTASTEKAAGANGALALSPEDVRRLLEDASTQARVDITDKIASAYGTDQLEDSELVVAEQIFRLLLRDTEVRVRASLANHLKESKAIPRDIVLTLARDVESVSLPVLQFSEVLTEEDLVEFVQHSNEVSRFLAVSKRRSVSQVVSNALLNKKNDQINQSLVSNAGADISEEDFSGLIDEYRSDPKMMETITSRPKLPVATVEKLITQVSDKLAKTLKEKYKYPAKEIETQVQATRESETLQLVSRVSGDHEIDSLVVQMHSSERLTPSMILGALCQGNFVFFEAALARMSNIPTANARSLIQDKGDLGFRAIYNKSGLPEAMFPAVKMLLKIVRELVEVDGEKPGKSRFANRIVERLLSKSEEDPVENLSYIIALVRRSVQ
jgi:uncharacterized protein (DUF2336 family)